MDVTITYCREVTQRPGNMPIIGLSSIFLNDNNFYKLCRRAKQV